MLIDTHCHLNYSPLKDNIEDVLNRSMEAGVERILCVGTSVETSEFAINLAEKYNFIFATAGVHPHDVEAAGKGWEKEIEIFCEHSKCIAIGEIGVDHYRDYSPAELQKKFFHALVEMAKSLDLPMIVHNRHADEDVAEILEIRDNHRGVLHCYSSDWDYAEKMLEKGMLLSFTGNVTYGSKKTEKVVKNIPLDKFMVETDAPFLAPSSKRGKTNEPAWLPLTAAKIAELKGISLDEVATATTKTAIEFFRLPL